MPWPTIYLLDTDFEIAGWFLALVIILALQLLIVTAISYYLLTGESGKLKSDYSQSECKSTNRIAHPGLKIFRSTGYQSSENNDDDDYGNNDVDDRSGYKKGPNNGLCDRLKSR